MLQNRINQAVKFLNAIIPQNSTLAVLRNVRVIQKRDKIIYEATDIDNFLRITLPIWSEVEGEYLVNAKILTQLSNKIATKIGKEKVNFGKVSLANNDVKEFPSLEMGFFKAPLWEINSANTKELVLLGQRLCRYAANDGDYRATLQGVCLRDGIFIATDGHRLLRCENSLKAKKSVSCVIPQAFFKLLGNEFVIDDVVDMAAYQSGEKKSIVARGMSFELVCNLLDGDYPNIDNVLPKSFGITFRVDKEQFLGTVNEALKYTCPKTSRVEISTPKSSSQFQIKSGDTERGTEFTDFLPVKNGNKKKWNGICVNGKFLSAILHDCAGRSIEIKTNERSESAIAIKSSDAYQMFLLMPLRKDVEPEEKPGNGEPQSPAETDKKEEKAAVSKQ